MASVGQFGTYYNELANRFFHAIEWQYKKAKTEDKNKREVEILSKILDTMIADAVNHDIELFRLEAANKEFVKIRDKSFSPKKYNDVLKALNIQDDETKNYTPQLFGVVQYDVRAVSNI